MMIAHGRDIPSTIVTSAHQGNKTIILDDAIAITDDQAVTHRLCCCTTNFSSSSSLFAISFISSSHLTASVPIDLLAISGQHVLNNWYDWNIGSLCGKKGHWSAICRIRVDWRMGDPINGVGYHGQGGQSSHSSGFCHSYRRSDGAGFHIIEGTPESDGTERLVGSQRIEKALQKTRQNYT
ncbi:hypothetical protein L873DRAFT_660484 [Choiromyces venosus 120613-1]|uniref:Uncharacterized protein n=1 Tax=Choiromyces venosus 120613-1 TaxID=1336337 RepID=A0A3N4IUF3_9PEZI|nr:hypothetical protein L873DRAFT_660484 [Choiromyces venosus 120613-1]